MECGSRTAIRYEHPHAIAVPILCKQWTCDRCGPTRKRRLIAQALSGGPVTFITLTTRYSTTGDPNAEAARMSNAFSTLVKRIRRRPDTPEFEYCAVFESTKNGWPHLHILTRTPWLPKGWLKNNWHDLTGSYIIDIRRVTDANKAAEYVSKYVGKSPHKFTTCKRYRFSLHYRPELAPDQQPTPTPGVAWQLLPVTISNVLSAWSQLHFRLEEATPLAIIAQPTATLTLNPLDGVQMDSPSISYTIAKATLQLANPFKLPAVYPNLPDLTPTPSQPPTG